MDTQETQTTLLMSLTETQTQLEKEQNILNYLAQKQREQRHVCNSLDRRLQAIRDEIARLETAGVNAQ